MYIQTNANIVTVGKAAIKAPILSLLFCNFRNQHNYGGGGKVLNDNPKHYQISFLITSGFNLFNLTPG
ncbi:hypothetical protein VII_000754 [Vibrio mimicus MB451]|nr:hypothetical protein VII_000754 [Vibrio mimicus MB451]